MSTGDRLLLVGGASEIGLAIAEAVLVERGSVTLAGRPSGRLDAAAARLRSVGHDTTTVGYEATWGAERTEAMLDEVWQRSGSVDTVVLSVGAMAPERPEGSDGSPPATAAREAELERMLTVNLVGPALVLDGCAARLAAQGRGTVVVISSAAAVRPRQGILGYAAAKQALDTLARGTDRRLRTHGARCLVVRPGRVSTRMSAGLPEVPLTQDAAQVARRVRQALGANTGVAWSPRLVGPLTTALRWTPDPLLPRTLR